MKTFYLSIIIFCFTIIGFTTLDAFSESYIIVPYSIHPINDTAFAVTGVVKKTSENTLVTLEIKNNSNNTPIFIAQTIPVEGGNFTFIVPKTGPLWQNVKYYSVIVNYVNSPTLQDNSLVSSNASQGTFLDVIKVPISLQSPLKQFKQNKDAYSIDCGQNLLLVVNKNNIPACVKETTASKLWNRGWVNKSTDFYAKYASPDVLEKFQSKIISNQKAIQIVQDYIKENNIKLNVNTTSPGFKIVTSLNYEIISSDYNNLLDVDPKTGIPTQVMTPWTIYYKNPQWWAELEKYYLSMNNHRIESGNLVWHVDYRECTECIAPYPIFLVDAITGQVVLTPYGIPYGIPEKITTEETNKTSSILKISVSLDNQDANPAQPIGIYISLSNPNSSKLTLIRADSWPRADLSPGPCSNLPFGIAILKGYYTEQNMSNAHSLALFSALPCPFQPKIKSYTFEPMSSKATYDCDSLFSCTGPVDMKTHFELTGFVTGDNPHHPFDIGTYTLVVGDQWGDIVIQHFSEEYVIAYDKNPVNENKNGTTSNMPKVTGFGIHSFGGSIKLGSDDSFNETEYYTGNVGNIIAGLPVHVSISNPYDMFTHEYDVSSSSIMPDGSFNFTHTFLGKFGQDTYTLDFTYGAQKYELRFIPVVPP